jgi:histidyl-tRNA synthetase
LDKIGEKGVEKILSAELKDAATIQKILELARIQSDDLSFVDRVRALGVTHEIFEQGLTELSFVMRGLSDLPKGSVVADLKIARGLDYYTGTVYEGFMKGFEKLGAVCSGGRYDNLASFDDVKLKLPGVGVSIGLTRILSKLFSIGYFKASRKTPTCVLVSLTSEESRAKAHAVAATLRSRGIATEVFHEPLKFGKQIRYAEKKGIPFVWFTEVENSAAQAVKDIRSGEQIEADPLKWTPSNDDLKGKIEKTNG